MMAGPFKLSGKRRRELYRRTLGRRLWLAVAIMALAGYLKYERALYGTSGNLVYLAVAICVASALRGLYQYLRQGRFRIHYLMDGDQMILTYPNLKRVVLNRDTFRSVSPDGGVLYFAGATAPVDGVFAKKITPLGRAVLDWLLETELSKAALHESRDRRDELALHKEQGIFARVPRSRMHFYAQLPPIMGLISGLYSRFVAEIFFDDGEVIRYSLFFSVVLFLIVELMWLRAKQRVRLLKTKQDLARLEEPF